MRYIEPPDEYDGAAAAAAASVFLAGGISGCHDWQREAAGALGDSDLVVINPRRANFPIDDPAAAAGQIAWEFRHLRRATARLFWFPPPTLCPIALFELGAWSRGAEPLFVGADPAYARRRDVIEQLKLARPDVAVVDALGPLVDQVRRWATTQAANGTKP